jgi:hypothetical protein
MYWRYARRLIAATSRDEPSGIQIIDYSESQHIVRVATSLIYDHTVVVSTDHGGKQWFETKHE